MAWFELNMNIEEMSGISDSAAKALLVSATALAISQPVVYAAISEVVKKLVQENPVKEAILVIAREKLAALGWTPK